MRSLNTIWALLIVLTASSVGFSQVSRSATPTPKKYVQSQQLYPVMVNGRVGFIDKKGRVLIKPRFLNAGSFNEGLARVMIGTERNYLSGFIDTTGKMVIKTRDSPGDFSSGVAAMLVHSISSQYYMDKTGRLVTGYYENAHDCKEGLCAVQLGPMPAKHMGYINTSGAVVVKGQYDWAVEFSEGFGRVGIMIGEPYMVNGAPANDGKEGYVDRTGHMLTPLKFDKARDFKDGMAQVRLGDKWGYIDKTGEIVIPPRYDDTEPFEAGFARVKIDGRWGYIDKQGQVIIAPQFEKADDFSEDWAVVERQGKAFFIDKSGNTVLSTPYTSLGGFRNGVAVYRIEGKQGLIDKKGTVIVRAQPWVLTMDSPELITIQDPKGYGYMDYEGKIVWQPRY